MCFLWNVSDSDKYCRHCRCIFTWATEISSRRRPENLYWISLISLELRKRPIISLDVGRAINFYVPFSKCFWKMYIHNYGVFRPIRILSFFGLHLLHFRRPIIWRTRECNYSTSLYYSWTAVANRVQAQVETLVKISIVIKLVFIFSFFFLFIHIYVTIFKLVW